LALGVRCTRVRSDARNLEHPTTCWNHDLKAPTVSATAYGAMISSEGKYVR